MTLGIVHGIPGPAETTTGKRRPTRDDFLVRGLEKIVPAYDTFDGTMYAGLLSTTPLGTESSVDAHGEFMFWLFEPHHALFDDRLLIWNNGGPGCSSLGGCLFEHCPVVLGEFPAGYERIDPHTPLQSNTKWAWTNASPMLYVEQPHGTGFSTGTFPHNETEMARDFYGFLRNFYDVFDNYASQQLFLAGESYAGMYIPSLAHYIQQENAKKQNSHINLAGIALGNGWIDADTQGPSVIDYAWWHGMIDSSTKRGLHQIWEQCQAGAVDLPPPFHPFTTPDECNIMGAVLEAAGAGAVRWGTPNAYDVSTWDAYDVLDDVDGTMAQFYNTPAVQDALNVVPHRHWIECMPGAGRRLDARDDHQSELPGKHLLAHDEPRSVAQYIAALLDAGIRVLIYNGDRDMTTNVQGSEQVLDAMEWKGSGGWNDGNFTRGLWLASETKVGGYTKTYKDLEFVVVLNSGHLVPMNVPEAALDLVTRFLNGSSFVDRQLPVFLPTKEDSVVSEHKSIPPDNRNWTSYSMLAVGFVLGCTATLCGMLMQATKKHRGYYRIPNGEEVGENTL